MTDEESSILDFYPSEFESDTDGKRFLWQSICKLPFIDEERLLAATKRIEKDLSEEEAKRNVRNRDQLFVHSSEDFASQIMSAFNDLGSSKQYNLTKIDKCMSGEMSGFVSPKLESVNVLNVLCVYYDPPSFQVHIPRMLEGTTIPEMVVSESDIEEKQLWHDIHGYQGRSNWNKCPDIVTKGAGNGWNTRGRGKRHDVTRTPNKQTTGGDTTNVVGARKSPGVCFRNPFPDIVIKGAGNGWNPRGQGRSQDVTRAPNEQTIGQSWGDTNRRGAQGNHGGRTSGANGQGQIQVLVVLSS